MLAPLLSLLLATRAVAPPTLSPEAPVEADVTFGPAAYGQVDVSVASNGRTFLAIWQDGRSRVGPNSQGALYATGINDDGTPKEPLGHSLAHFAYANAIASDGDAYLAVYFSESGLWSVRLDDDGHPISPPHNLAPLGSAHDRLHLAWNGTEYIVVISQYWQYPSQMRAILLDRQGWAVASTVVADHAIAGGVLTTDAGFEVVAIADLCNPVPCSRSVVLYTVTNTGAVAAHTLAAAPNAVSIAVAASPNRILVEVLSGVLGGVTVPISIDSSIFARDGTLIHAEHLHDEVRPSNWNSYYNAISAECDGTDFLASWNLDRTTLFSIVIGASGQHSEPVVFDAAGGSPPAFAKSANAKILAWASPSVLSPSIVSRVMHSFREFPASAPVLVTMSAPAQSDVAMASTPAGPLAIWRDNRDVMLLRAGIAGHPATTIADLTTQPVSSTAVAASRSLALIAWNESGTGSEVVIKGVRMTFAGEILDREAITIAHTTYDFGTTLGVLSIASDGSDFLVCWNAGGRVVGAVVKSTGAAQQPAEINGPSDYRQYSPTVSWAGTAYVVTWHEDRSRPPSFPGSPIPGPALVFARAVDPNSIPAKTSRDPLNPNETALSLGNTSATSGPNGVTIAWTARPSYIATTACVYAMTVSASTTVVNAARSVYCRSTYDGHVGTWFGATSIAWDGSSYVLVWNETREPSYFLDPQAAVLGLRLDASLNVIDTQPFIVAAPQSGASNPAIVRTDTGTFVAYAQLAGRTFGDVARLYGRHIDPIVHVRARTARH